MVNGPHMRIMTVALLLLAACRANFSFTGAEIPVDAKTVSVTLFDARAPLASPRSAQVITETLRDLLQAQTPLNLTQQDGDIRYEGELTAYDVQPVNIQGNETAALNRLTITVNVRYMNTLDTEKNVEATYTRFADYDSSNDLTAVEETLVQQIGSQLAQDIFDRTLGSW